MAFQVSREREQVIVGEQRYTFRVQPTGGDQAGDDGGRGRAEPSSMRYGIAGAQPDTGRLPAKPLGADPEGTHDEV